MRLPGRETVLTLLLAAAASIVVTWPLALRITSAIPGGIGDPVLNAWILAWDADRALHGGRGLWDAPIFFPYRGTLAYSENLLGIAAFVAPVQWTFRNPILTYNVAFLLAYAGCFAGMYLLVLHLTGRRDAAIVAAAAYGLAPYRAGQVTHLQVLTAGWLPVAMWGLHRYFAGPEGGGRASFPALATFVAAYLLQALSNGYFLFFAALPICVLIAAELWKLWPRIARPVLHLAAAALVFLAVMAPVVSAYLSLRERGLTRAYGEWTHYSADLADYGRTNPAARITSVFVPDGEPERELFPGLTVVILGLVAIVGSRRGPATMYLVVVVAAVALSLGPEPHAWGRQIAPSGPYGWAVRLVPGLDGLRVPARLAMIVAFGLSVLAGLGAARLVRHRDRAAALALAIGLTSAVALEGWMAPVRLTRFDARGLASDRVTYEWLSGAPAGGVLELPIAGPAPARFTMRYLFGTLVHRHPIVNGYSGYGSPLQDFLGGPESPLGELNRVPALLDALRALGVRYIVLHRRAFNDREAAAALETAIDAASSHIAERRTFGDTVVWRLLDRAPDRPHELQRPTSEIPLSDIRVEASISPERIGLMLDGDPESRWLTGPQQGREEILLSLNAPRNLARIVMTLTRRSFGDYPRELLIEGSADGVTFTSLYRGSVLPQFMRGIVTDARHAPIAIDLPPNATRILRIRQVATSRTWFWSVHELRVYER